MTLVSWQPNREIDILQRQLNRLFDEVFELPVNRNWHGIDYIPRVELETTVEAVNLRVEIPGIDPKELDIQVTKDSVSLTGVRQQTTTTDEKGIKKTEFVYGKFHRVIPLPVLVQNANVTAEYKDGILHLTLPKQEEEKNKVVKVNLG